MVSSKIFIGALIVVAGMVCYLDSLGGVPSLFGFLLSLVFPYLAFFSGRKRGYSDAGCGN